MAAQARPSGVKRVDALSTSVRLVITYSFMGLYGAVKIAAHAAAIDGVLTWLAALPQAWMEADQALWAGVLNCWFIGRAFERARP